MDNKYSQVVLLPAQRDRLASLSTKGAIGITQDGSVLHIDTGEVKFSIDAEGKNINPPNQEALC